MNLYIHTLLQVEMKEELLKTFGSDHVFRFNDDPGNRPDLSDVDVIMGNPPPESMQPFPPRVVFWQLDSAGFDQYSSIKTDIPVSNMGSAFATSCAETMIAGILAFYRGIHLLVRLQDDQNWQGKNIRSQLDRLENKKILILGAGEIGQKIRKLLQGFTHDILLAARKNPSADLHGYDAMIEVLPTADIVINTLPGTAKDFVQKEFFGAMMPGALYCSVGRGNTTVEADLIDALRSGKLVGAVLDVTRKEPLPADNLLWTFKNIILTQHTAGGYREEEYDKVKTFASNLAKFMAGQKPDNLVQLSQGY